MNELRWGVLSTADIGLRAVIPALQSAQRSRVVSIGSREQGRAESAAASLGIARAFGSYDQVLADPDVDAVYIPLPNHVHLEWTLRAAEAGKHVLCEKPLAMTSADAQRMVDACAAAGVYLAEAFMYRTHPLWLSVRDLVASGRIGGLAGVQSWFSYFNDDPADIRNNLEYGGGALYDIGCYCINLSRVLFEGEPTAAKASLVRDPASGVDTTATVVMDFGGAFASFVCSMRAAHDQRVHIHGTRGWVHIPIPFNIPSDRPSEIWLQEVGPSGATAQARRIEFPTYNAYVAQAEAFIATVLDGAPPLYPTEDAVANMRAIELVMAAGSE